MKKLNKNPIVAVTVALALLFGLPGLTGPVTTHAATATLVDLGTAGNFAILSNAGITDSSASAVITGNIGVYPITGASIGVTCAEVSGTIYDRDAAYTGAGGGSTACLITDDTLLNVAADTATGDMFTAYTATATETAGTGTFLDVGTGTLGTPGVSQNFVPGVYTWGSAVTITDDIFLNGNSTDVWVFQISGTLDISSAKQVHLTGGAQAKNVFWQVTGATTLGTTSIFEGNILGATGITITTGATLHGRALAGTSVALQAGSVVTIPTPDTTAPVITLVGSTPVNLTVGDSYSDAGATALDDIDGDITGSIATVNPVNTSVVGVYTITYNVTDSSTNDAVEVTRTVNVSAVPTPPPAPSSGGGGSTVYCTEERATFCRPVSNQTIGASIEGQVLGAFSPDENQAQIDTIRDSLISLLKQLINLLQAQIVVMQSTPGFPNTGFVPK